MNQQLHVLDGFSIAGQFRRMATTSYNSHAIDGLQVLRQAKGYKPRFAAVPDHKNIAVPARKQFEGQLWLPPRSIIWAISGVSEQPQGFRLQILDASTGEKFYAAPQRFDPQSGDLYPNQKALLIKPRVVLEPGLFNVTITNLSSSANTIQVVIFYAAPPDAPLDVAGLQLAQELQDLRAARGRGLFNGSSAAGSGSASNSNSGSSSSNPPWLVMPPLGQPFREAGSIPTPEPGSEAVIHSFSVPAGWDGCIRALSNQYGASGFEEGSGQLVWRLRIDGAHVKGFDNITTQLGSSSAPFELQGSIRIYSGQLVEYVVSHTTGSPLPTSNAQSIATLGGWFWPKE